MAEKCRVLTNAATKTLRATAVFVRMWVRVSSWQRDLYPIELAGRCWGLGPRPLAAARTSRTARENSPPDAPLNPAGHFWSWSKDCEMRLAPGLDLRLRNSTHPKATAATRSAPPVARSVHELADARGGGTAALGGGRRGGALATAVSGGVVGGAAVAAGV